MSKPDLRDVRYLGSDSRSSVRVSREELLQTRGIWMVQGATLVGIALCTFLLAFVLPSAALGPMLGFATALALIGVVFLSTKTPPPVGTLGNHASLISVYGPIGLAELAYAPDWWVPLGAAMFIGPLVAMRCTTRREIALHLVAATACLGLPALTESPSATALAGVVATIAAVWTLTGIVDFLLEQAEAQGRLLEVLLRRDPLTGVGNQRLLDERLEAELSFHAQLRQPLTLLAVDLAEFSELNERFGRTACDELLGRAAAAMRAVLRPEATIARPGADEFWIVLPGADDVAASDTIAELRWALASVALPTEPVGLAAAVGTATYPGDGVRADALTELARGRMVADRESGHYVPPPITASARARPAPAVLDGPPLVRGLSREHLAEHPMLWRVASAIYGVAAVVALVLVARDPGVRSFVVLAAVVVSAASAAAVGRASLGRLENHVFLASTYCGAAVAFWALQPDPELAIAVSAFIPPLIAVRLQTRRAILGHLAAVGVVFIVVVAAGIATGDLNRPTILVVLLLIPTTWSLALSCMLGLEFAEEQGRELERLVRIDPVTGVGNRHMLEEQLAGDLARHDEAGQPLSVVLLELVETFENSREASELLLQAAAETISAAVSPGDAVIRRRGHEFALILRQAHGAAVSHTVLGVRASLTGLARRGHRMETIDVVASFPEDGRTPAELLAAADARLGEARAAAELDRPNVLDSTPRLRRAVPASAESDGRHRTRHRWKRPRTRAPRPL